MLSWRAATGWPSTSARISTPSPYSASHGARMNTARHRPFDLRRSRGPPRSERIWRPNALRTHSVSMQPRCSRSSMIIPAQVPSTGLPLRHERAQRVAEPFALDAERHRRRLAARHHQPVEPVEVGGHADLAHLGAEALQHLGMRFEVALQGENADYQPRLASSWPLFELARLERLHRHAEALGRVRDALRVPEVRGRLDDRRRARGRVLGLEDARADEHALGAELHHQRRVGRGGDAAGAEQRRPAACRPRPRPAHEIERRLQLLGRGRELHVVQRTAGGGSTRGSRAGGARPRRCRRCRPRPWSGSSPRPRRSGAAPRPGWSRRTRTGP